MCVCVCVCVCVSVRLLLTQDNELVIALEWAEAGDLAALLRSRAEAQQPFAPQEVWGMFTQVRTAYQSVLCAYVSRMFSQLCITSLA